MGWYETNLGFNATYAFPPSVLLTEATNSEFVRAGGREGVLSNPYVGMTTRAMSGPLVARYWGYAPINTQSVKGGSTYQARLNQTPINNGSWTGLRGESTFISNKPELKPFLGEGGIRYSNAFPDFAPVSAGGVRLPPISADRPVNFMNADKAYATQVGATPGEITSMRSIRGLTWHEGEDMRRMILVPTTVHGSYPHLGGIGQRNAGGTVKGGR